MTQQYCNCEEFKDAYKRGIRASCNIPEVLDPFKYKEVCDFCGKRVKI